MEAPQKPDKPKKLNARQQLFVDEYLQCFNASEAARRAGYSVKAAYSIGGDLLRIPEISEQIDERLRASHMRADEVLQRLADMARGDIGEMLDNFDRIDLRKARAEGKTHLIKKIKQKTVTSETGEITEIELELYDAQAALEKIGKRYGLFTDRVDVTSGGKPLERLSDAELIALLKASDTSGNSETGKG